MIRLRIFRTDGVCDVYEFDEEDIKAITVEDAECMKVYPTTIEAEELVFNAELPDENPEISLALDIAEEEPK